MKGDGKPWDENDSMGISLVSVPTVVDAAVVELRKLIMSGQLRPGERLVEERLTERLGVSRPPLREALRLLQRDGLVQSSPRRGFIVIPMTADEVREIYTLRMALERLAVELAVPLSDVAAAKPLQAAMEEMRAAVDARDDDRILDANSVFHRALVGLARHSRLERTYDALRMQMSLCMAYNLKLRQRLYENFDDAVERHESLLQKVLDGDRDAALRELQHHGADSFLSHLDELLGSAP